MAQDPVEAPDPMSLDPGYVARSQAPELVQKAARWDSSDPRRLAMSPWQYDPKEGKVHWATPHSITGPVSGMAQAMMHLTDAIHGVYHPAADPKGAINDALSVAAAAIPAGASAPRGAIGMFAGAKARTADKSALELAQSMEGAASPKSIWDTTGWFKGPDKQWKHEISDEGAKLGPDVQPLTPGGQLVKLANNGTTLGRVLDHPALYQAYPELADLPVSRVPMQHIMSMKGAAAQDGSKIYLGADKPEDFLSTLLHETQHVIQSKEGFGIGGSPSEWWTHDQAKELNQHLKDKNQLTDIIDQLGHNSSKASGAMDFDLNGWTPAPTFKAAQEKLWAEEPELHDALLDKMTKIQNLKDQQRQALDNYHGLAGEVEANTVQERHRVGSGPDTAPWETTGYPTGPQMVRFLGRDGVDGAAALPPGKTLEDAKASDLSVSHLGGRPMEEMEELEEVPQTETAEGAPAP